jgi:negative regulator of replication initiation
LNDKLLELKQKKLRQKVGYLRTELEETVLIFQDALVEFENEFGEFFRKKPTEKDNHKRITTEQPEFNIPRKDVNTIFKKIAQKTHPDKFAHTNIPKKILKEKIKIYQEAVNAVENKDWAKVVDIADELNIKVDDVKKDDTIYLEESVDGLTGKIKDLQSTYAWIWTSTNTENKEELKKQILKSLGLSDK